MSHVGFTALTRATSSLGSSNVRETVSGIKQLRLIGLVGLIGALLVRLLGFLEGILYDAAQFLLLFLGKVAPFRWNTGWRGVRLRRFLFRLRLVRRGEDCLDGRFHRFFWRSRWRRGRGCAACQLFDVRGVRYRQPTQVRVVGGRFAREQFGFGFLLLFLLGKPQYPHAADVQVSRHLAVFLGLDVIVVALGGRRQLRRLIVRGHVILAV